MNKLVLTVIGIILAALLIIYIRDGSLVFVRPESQTVYKQLKASPHVQQTVAVMDMAQIATTLQTNEALTVLVPTNDAYERLPKDILLKITEEESDVHNKIYTANNHVIRGIYPSSSFYNGMTMLTINGDLLTLSKKQDGWYINESVKLTALDKVTTNGVIHEINQVLVPLSVQQ